MLNEGREARRARRGQGTVGVKNGMGAAEGWRQCMKLDGGGCETRTMKYTGCGWMDGGGNRRKNTSPLKIDRHRKGEKNEEDVKQNSIEKKLIQYKVKVKANVMRLNTLFTQWHLASKRKWW